LGSSFAFIGGILTVKELYGLPYATGGIVVAGLLYLVLAGLVKFYGVQKVRSFFPPVVTGSMIMVIGLTLAPVLINNNIVSGDSGTLSQRWIIAMASVTAMIIISIFTKGFFKMLPILFGIAAGYVAATAFGMVNLTAVGTAQWIEVPGFFLPRFSLAAIGMIAPIALVTFMEHIGDVTTNGAVVGKDFMTDPGLDRTLIGDGLATIFAGLIGAPANTTYSENTAVLAVTKNYNPAVLKIAAAMAIALSFIGKFGSLIATIPAPVMGGISIILFGMIAAIGMKTIVDGKVDYSKTKNLIISALMIVFGLSGVVLPLGRVGLTGLSLAAVLGVVLNKVLPEGIE
ncbi:MAG: solute carrier family 23 protein, partial [Bacillota bacterium]|nr:solute carrier family 23 protein [Bacillota bacterium]